MAREEFLDELSDDFPSKRLYSYDENSCHETKRRFLMDAVFEGTFEQYECNVNESDFGYKITADVFFLLDVTYKEDKWQKSFSYIAEAFEIAEAAYRFFVVVPRVLDEGEVLLSNERTFPIGPESLEMHDHCMDDDVSMPPVELVFPSHLRVKGEYLLATIFLCTDGTYATSVIHARAGKHSSLLDKYFTDPDFAELIVNAYIEVSDKEFPGAPDEVYQHVYKRVTH